jgi:hypothetical protein
MADFQHDRVLRYINAFGKHPPVGSADTPFLMPPSRTLPKFPLGCSETRAHPPKSRAHAFPFSKEYRTQQVLHICYAIDMQQRLTLESQLVLTRRPLRRSLVVGLRGDRLVARLNGDIGGPRASSRAPRCSQRMRRSTSWSCSDGATAFELIRENAANCTRRGRGLWARGMLDRRRWIMGREVILDDLNA